MRTTSNTKYFATRITAIMITLYSFSVGYMWGTTTSSVTISDYATAHSWSNSTQYSSVAIDANVTATVSSGTNTGKYYSTDNTWRLYQTETAILTITTEVGVLTSVTITYAVKNTGVLKNGETDMTSGTAYSVSGSSKTFSVGNTSEATNGQVQITAISVSYDESATSSYAITYDANGGAGTTIDSNSPYEDGSSVTVMNNSFTAPDAYVFDHWNTAADGSGTDYNPGDHFTITAAITLYAQWVADTPLNYALANLEDLTSEDVFIIVGHNGSNYAMTHDKGTSHAPDAVSVTITNDIISTASKKILWNISGNSTDGYTFYPNGSTTTWLYCTNTNDGVRVGSNDNKVFTLSGDYLQNTATSRYMGIYNSQDWRCYTSTDGNIADQTFAFYKLEAPLTFFRTACRREFDDSEGDGLWSTEENWTNNRLPTIKELVDIKKPVTVDITDAKAKSVILNQYNGNTGSLDIQAGKELVIAQTLQKKNSSGSLVATDYSDINIGSSAAGNGALVVGGYTTGNNKATVNFYSISGGSKNISASVNQYVGTPFNDETNILHNWYNSWVYEIDYTGAAPAWSRINAGDGMTPFRGYDVISADGSGHIYWQQGTLNATVNQTISGLSYKSGDGSNTANENLLANSWTAPIRIAAFTAGDFVKTDATIYIFNSGSPDDYEDGETEAGQYSTYPIGSAGNNIIPSMQAFSVYTNADGGSSVTLNYNNLVYVPALAGTAAIGPNRAPRRAKAGNGETNGLQVFVKAESGYGDHITIYERGDLTEGFDNGWDGRKMFGESVAPQLYAVTSDGNMAINCIPDVDGALLGFRKGSKENIYTFTFDYDGKRVLYLNDLKEDTSVLINSANTYTFVAAANDNEVRFVISTTPLQNVITGISGLINSEQTSVRKILHNGQIYIIRNGRIYDAKGAMIK